ncbi:hypothetical protein [uncultured Bacteroides sp.]|uniref:hypothetical protein n=1 Tax=uncultured Bacteroides sp. TaxID=162156 RepID=UPI002AA956CE|nr:hypothetical protein [uncultured Bacteroides sp.]
MITIWNNLWKQLETATDDLNNTMDSGMPAIAQQKLSKFIKSWDKLKEIAMSLDDKMQNPIDPIDIKLPFDEEEFEKVWKYWKEYRLESFGKTYKSREEQKVLDYLDELSGGSPDTAIKFLNFAMAGSYPKFFKISDKNYTNPPKELTHDSDFG